MANFEHVEILKQGVGAWNKWRDDNPEVKPDLERLDINKLIESPDSSLEVDSGRCNLNEINLSVANLRDTKFENADLIESKLDGARFDRACFKNANLFQANFAKSIGHKTIFSKADLTDCDISDAQMPFSNFSWAALSDTKLVGSKMIRAKIDHAELSHADLKDADLSGCNLEYSILDGCSLEKAKLINVNFSFSNLVNANLSSCDLKRSNFEQANVSNVVFAKSSTQKNFQGIRVSTCYGSQRFKTFAQDQDFIEELRGSGNWGTFTFWAWWLLADCGRSFLRWAGWSLLFALSFAAIFFYGLGTESFNIKGPPAESFQTMIYYSVVTFTTLGFGDVTPITTTAAWWVMAEVVLGYIMLGGLISILANKLARRS